MKWYPLLLLFLAFPAYGQEAALRPYCGLDFTEADQVALKAFQEARAAGTLSVARKHLAPPEIGDLKMFNVLEDQTWLQRTFTLKDKTDQYYLWVENGELENGHVTADEITGLRSTLLNATPAKSYNPQAGILANDEFIFGEPPDYDGDGITDILLYDIGSSGTLGYVTSQDLNPNAAEGNGNQADVLYLDANEGTRNLETLSVIAAHEYTHLIHFNYGFDQFTFISEGLAEYAIVMNGYFWRPINYINEVGEYTRALFSWRDTDDVFKDYERGSLFFTYIGTRIGPEATGSFVRTPPDTKGAAGLSSVLEAHGTTLMEVLTDFHVANYLNDTALNPVYGYPMPERQLIHAPPTRVFDGTADVETQVAETIIESGSPRYIVWNNVTDFRLSLDVLGADIFLNDLRNRTRVRVVLDFSDGHTDVQALEPGPLSRTFNGTFNRVTVVLMHVAPEILKHKVTYAAFWRKGSTTTAVDEAETLPKSVVLDSNYPNPFNPTTTVAYTLPRALHVRLTVHDLLGRQVATLADGLQTAGRHEARFEAGNLPSGLYLYALETEGRKLTRTMLLTK